MEIIFQNTKLFALKSKPSRKKSFKKNKFLGVRQRPSGKWVAEIKNTTQKLRMWLGTFDTAEEAARAYDEAAFLLRGSSTRRNFVDNCSPDSHISMKVKSLFNQKKASKQNLTFNTTNSSTKTTKKTNSQTSSHVLPIGFNQGFNMIHEQLLNYNFSFQLPKPVMETSITTSSQTSSFQSYSGDTSPTTFEYSYQDLQMFFQLPKPVIDTTSSHTSTTTSSQTNSFQSYSGDTSPTTSEYSYQDLQTFDDDAYKPDLSHCLGNEENTMGPFKFGQVFGDEFYQLLSTKEEFLVPKSEDFLPEFEHMMVERQISASLYAMNGVNEYWENFNNFNNSLLDLPMVSQMFCST